jgi:hypothetical protein
MAKEKNNASGDVNVNAEATDMVLASKNEVSILVDYDPFSTPSKDDIFYISGLPREWRSICSNNGGFKIGEKGRLETELKMQVLFFEDYPQTIFFEKTYQKNPIQDWVFIYFVDSENQLSTMFLKGRSRDNFIELLRTIAGKGKSIGSQVVTAYMNDKTSEVEINGQKQNVTYNIVYFKTEDNTPEKTQILKDFWIAQDNGKKIYSTFLNEIVEQSGFVKGQKKGEIDGVFVDEETGEVLEII